jgi:DNA invertase Pin-like site-specific DNA recombinase
MIAIYARSVKNYLSTSLQKASLLSYAELHGLKVDKSYIENSSTAKRLDDRSSSITYLQSLKNQTLIIYDVWVLSTHADELVRIFSCLYKNNVTIHITQTNITVDKSSPALLVLGLIDALRSAQTQENEKRSGRPKGSQSHSKYDKYSEMIIEMLRNNITVSDIARQLDVSRSSLNDYIRSRELKRVAKQKSGESALNSGQDHQEFMDNIECPTPTP